MHPLHFNGEAIFLHKQIKHMGYIKYIILIHSVYYINLAQSLFEVLPQILRTFMFADTYDFVVWTPIG